MVHVILWEIGSFSFSVQGLPSILPRVLRRTRFRNRFAVFRSKNGRELPARWQDWISNEISPYFTAPNRPWISKHGRVRDAFLRPCRYSSELDFLCFDRCRRRRRLLFLEIRRASVAARRR